MKKKEGIPLLADISLFESFQCIRYDIISNLVI